MVAFTLAPAHAGDSPNIQICHATSSETNPYNPITVSKNSIIKGVGHGADTGDIIPPFEYSEKKDGPLVTYPGQNWNPTNEAIYLNSCNIPLKVVAPVAPTYSPGTCELPTGSVTLPNQPEGVILNSGPVLDGNIWKVSYVPTAGYKFETETSGIFAFTVIGPDATDPNWDASTGGCGLPQVGAGDLTNLIIPAGGLLALGMALYFVTRRREIA